MGAFVILIICRGRYHIKKLFQRGIFAEYPLHDTKSFLKENLPAHENIRDDQIKSQYINVLERADDFFVHKFSFGKVCMQIILFSLLFSIYLIILLMKYEGCTGRKLISLIGLQIKHSKVHENI